MIKRKKYIPLLILVVFGVCLIFFNLKSSVEDIQYAKRIFKSERAFGDDYFDIYLINSKGKQDNRKKIDDDYYIKSKGFKQMMESYKSEIEDYDVLSNSISELEKDSNTVYFYQENIDKKGHSTLYIYNSDLDKGYIFNFQI